MRRIAENAPPGRNALTGNDAVTPTLSRLSTPIVRAAAAIAAALLVASCGGGVSANPSPVVDSPTLTILPATATLYSGMPTTFVLSGGTGAYIVASSDQAIVPVVGGVTGRSVTVVPNPVTAETTVTLTVRDTGTAAPVSATLTVRPGTVNNTVTITPTSSAASCAPALCSGGDAEVKVTISQGGIPLAARGVRFAAVAGSFDFIVSTTSTGAGTIESLAKVVDVATDETGVARARMRITASVPSQTALLRITEIASGAYRETSFAIAQYNGNNPSFFALPSAVSFAGPGTGVCASRASTSVVLFGGTPPYAITGGSGFYTASPSLVERSGDAFSLVLSSAAPVCLDKVPFGVTDATGRTITVTLSSVEGSGPTPITVAPDRLTLACSFSTIDPGPPPVTIVTAVTSSFVVSGGSGTVAASTDHPRVVATVTDRTVTLQRVNGDLAAYPAVGKVNVTDGNTTATVTLVVPTSCP